MAAVSRVISSFGKVSVEVIFGCTDMSWNMTCMSIRACLISLQTEPRKPSGTDSWNRRPLTMTRPPTLMLPARMSRAAMHMITDRAEENIKFWPKFSAARL